MHEGEGAIEPAIGRDAKVPFAGDEIKFVVVVAWDDCEVDAGVRGAP